MQDNAHQQLDMHKMQLIAGLGAVAEQLRNTAALAENFANLVQQTSFVPQSQATASNNSSSNFSMGMFPMFGQLFGGSGLPMVNGHQQPGQVLSPVDAKDEVEGEPKKRKRGRPGADEKEKKVKKVKDLFAPKRPPSAYILFQNEVRKAMQEKYPGLAYTEILGKVSERWAGLAPEQKSIYEALTKTAKDQYMARKKVYEDAVKTGLSNEAAHKLAEDLHPDPAPVAPAPVPVAAKKDSSDESDEESSVEAAEAAADSDAGLETDESEGKKAKDDSESDTDEEDDEEEEEEEPPKSKKQKTQKKSGVAASAPVQATITKEKESKRKESKKRDRKSKKDE